MASCTRGARALLVVACPWPAPSQSGRRHPRAAEARERSWTRPRRGSWRWPMEAQRAAWVQDDLHHRRHRDPRRGGQRARDRAPRSSARSRPRASTAWTCPTDVARKLKLLKLALTLPAPRDAEAGRGADPDRRRDGGRRTAGASTAGRRRRRQRRTASTSTRSSRILAESRDPKELLDAWAGWHAIAPPMREDFARFVELANKGARELGFADTGRACGARSTTCRPTPSRARWTGCGSRCGRSTCRCTPTCAASCARQYGADVVPAQRAHPRAPARQHVGAGVGQRLPAGGARRTRDPGFDLTAAPAPRRSIDAKEMVALRRALLHLARLRAAARDLLGALALHQAARPRGGLPRQRLGRRQRGRPAHQDVHRDHGRGLHAPSTTSWATTSTSAPTSKQPFLFRDSANDGFHEAIGDAIALSVTPAYLKQLGLLDAGAGRRRRTSACCCRWRSTRSRSCPSACSSTSGAGRSSRARSRRPTTTRPGGSCARSTRAWRRPSRAARPTSIPARSTTCPRTCPTRATSSPTSCSSSSTARCARPRARQGPLHRCSIYGNKEAGERLQKMLAMGVSRPWPDALEALTGERRMDATAILDYFAPLQKWLDEQNKGQTPGW